MSVEIMLLLVAVVFIGALAAVFFILHKNQTKIAHLKSAFQENEKQLETKRIEAEKLSLVW